MLAISRPNFRTTALALLALALVVAAAAIASQPTKRVVKEANNETLGSTVLTTLKGKTLYSLSAEGRGKFICDRSCLSDWKPLLIRRGEKPKGPVRLGTVERPEGATQVTYKGRPLYTFDEDTRSGEANGEGIKDVGTWHAAVVARLAPPPAPEAEPTPPPYPY